MRHLNGMDKNDKMGHLGKDGRINLEHNYYFFSIFFYAERKGMSISLTLNPTLQNYMKLGGKKQIG